MNHTYSHPLTFGLGKDGAPNALFDGLSRVVASFPTDRTHDTRRGSPSTPETILANAKLFKAAPALVRALVRISSNAAESPEWIRRVASEALVEIE